MRDASHTTSAPASVRRSSLRASRIVARRALGLRAPLDPQITRDGKYLAYALQELGSRRRQLAGCQIRVIEVESGASLALGPAEAHSVAPAWSFDNRRLAFLTAPLDGRHQLATASPPTTEFERQEIPGADHLVGPCWSITGRLAVLAMTAETRSSEMEWFPPAERGVIWASQADPRRMAPASASSLHVWEFSWLPDSRRFVAVASESADEGSWFSSRLVLMDGDNVVDLLDGLARDPRDRGRADVARPIAAPEPSPDGRHVAMIMGARSDRDIVGGDACVLGLTDGSLRNLTLARPMTVTCVRWVDEKTLLVAAYLEGDQAIARLTVDGTMTILWREKASIDRFWPRFSLSQTGKIAITHEDSLTPREVWIGDIEAEGIRWTSVTDHNRAAKGWSHPRFDDIRWQAADGTSIAGILIRPIRERSPRALVTWVHGGPNFLHQHLFNGWAYPWVLATFPELLAAAGFVVLLPNPRGSFGWGNDFAEAVIGDMGGEDASDILAGVTAVEQELGIDASNNGIGGWSYGGFMSAWLATTTRRFRAAVVGAGPMNWRSAHGTSALGRWDREYLRDDPYAINGEYDRRSPILHASASQTATLLVHGTADQFVPPGQAIEMYTALREAGCPVEMRLFPGEGHDFSSQRGQLKVADTIVQWYDRWLA